VAGGTIGDHKGVNMPSGNLTVEVPTKKDKEDLKFIAELKPDYVAASFVCKAADVEAIRRVLKDAGDSEVKLVSKIERPIALQNFDEILRASDGIMVARGDLGVEIPPKMCQLLKKRWFRNAIAQGNPSSLPPRCLSL